MPRRVVFIGNRRTAEFKSIVDWLGANVDLCCVEDISTAIERSLGGMDADSILVAPSHRAEFSLQAVRELQARLPLAQLYVVVSSWCEGETRSGNAWPGIERLYVHQVIPRARSDGWDRESPNHPVAPCTASNDERWLLRATQATTRDSGLVLICARHDDSRSTLVEVCRSAGWKTISIKSPRGSDGDPVAVIYDADRNLQRRSRELQWLSASLPDARLLTLIDYPRYDEIQHALEMGSDQVLGKPYDISDLLACLRPKRVSVQDKL